MIPPKLREDLSNDPFMKKCCITGRTDGRFSHAFSSTYSRLTA